MRTSAFALIAPPLVLFLVVGAAAAASFHRPRFRWISVRFPEVTFTLEYDRTDREHREDNEANVRLLATVARVLREERADLSSRYPVPSGRIAGAMSVHHDIFREDQWINPIAEMVSLQEDPAAVARLGAEEWARRQARCQLTQIALYSRVLRVRKILIKSYLARKLVPLWLPLGLSYAEAEPWDPEKMAMVADAAEHRRFIPLQQYTYLRTFNYVEKLRAIQKELAAGK